MSSPLELGEDRANDLAYGLLGVGLDDRHAAPPPRLEDGANEERKGFLDDLAPSHSELVRELIQLLARGLRDRRFDSHWTPRV
jgi:hypothetical protein